MLLNGPTGLGKMALLAGSAATLPISRLFISFVTPTMVYVPSSNTLATTGLNLSQTGDEGFAALKASVGALSAAGVDVILSLGGWDCTLRTTPARPTTTAPKNTNHNLIPTPPKPKPTS